MTAGRRARGRRVFLPLALAWAGVIFVLSERELRPGPTTVVWQLLHNGGHAAVFAALSALLLLGLPPGRATAIAGVVLASTYGAIDELHQSFVPGRVPSVTDWITDTCGAVLGLTIVLLLRSVPEDRPRRVAAFLGTGLACILSALLATLA